ncbi:hypothetical protein, partial [Comamonas sp.]|uniref:hypothetical protein n=1 Tax=Comamonas sp. TaxID=34028 RepID=UPI002FC89281
ITVSAAEPCIVARFFNRFEKQDQLFPFRFQPAVAGSAVFEAECKCSTAKSTKKVFFNFLSAFLLPPAA